MLEKKSKAGMVKAGYGQVEPNHLSAQRTGQIYAQLPTNKNIDVLENGQFVKYDYATGEVNFTGKGEWMLVYNEIKLYREGMPDCAFALKRGDYYARVYSPAGGDPGKLTYAEQTRFYGGKGYTPKEDGTIGSDGTHGWNADQAIEKVTAPADPFEPNYTEDPFHLDGRYAPKMVKDMSENVDNNSMFPRVFKTNIGDIFTTNTIKDATLEKGDTLIVGSTNGILEKSTSVDDAPMVWQVVKVYTVPDGQPGVKIMRIK